MTVICKNCKHYAQGLFILTNRGTLTHAACYAHVEPRKETYCDQVRGTVHERWDTLPESCYNVNKNFDCKDYSPSTWERINGWVAGLLRGRSVK